VEENIRIDETISFHHFTAAYADGMREHGSRVAEGMIFAVLAARVRRGGKLLEQHYVKLVCNKGGGYLSGIYASQHRSQTTRYHLLR
jgi:hypothetical protein